MEKMEQKEKNQKKQKIKKKDQDTNSKSSINNLLQFQEISELEKELLNEIIDDEQKIEEEEKND